MKKEDDFLRNISVGSLRRQLYFIAELSLYYLLIFMLSRRFPRPGL